jgi:hypothetical protein
MLAQGGEEELALEHVKRAWANRGEETPPPRLHVTAAA